MVILYCEKCGLRISDGDFKSSGAVRLDDSRAYCAACAKLELPGRARNSPKSSRLNIAPATPAAAHAAPATAHRTTRIPHGEREKAASMSSGMIGGVVGTLVVCGVLFAALRGGDKSSAHASAPPAPEPQSAKPVESPPARAPEPVRPLRPREKDPASAELAKPLPLGGGDMVALREELAQHRLAQARDRFAAAPRNLEAYREQLKEIVSSYRGTPAADDAARLLRELPAPEPSSSEPPQQQRSDGNLALDPGFESGKLGVWTAYGNGKVVEGHAHTGKWCAKAGKGDNEGVRQLVANLEPDTTYVMKAWMKVAGPGQEGFVAVKEFGGAEIREIVTETAYAEKTITFTTGAKNTTAKLIFGIKDNNAIFGDDFTLTKK